MKLEQKYIEQALLHLLKQSDSDLFPRPIEIDIISELEQEAIEFLSDLDLEQIKPNPSRKFLIPKGYLTYRSATQLDPLDGIFLTAIIYQYGNLLENKRLPRSDNRVFSSRFFPDNNGNLYDLNHSWESFWKECSKLAKKYSYIVKLDISDFYNQIYHHTLENQLIDCELPDQIIKWIINLLKSITANVSRGIPVGPHSIHLLAETSINPVDNSLISRKIEFCRYVDDFILFCNSKKEAEILVFTLAEILDKQQRLYLQSQKTKVFTSKEFESHCHEMIFDRPINDLEKGIVDIIKKYSGGNPYRPVYLNEISKTDLKKFKEDSINIIFDDYLKQKDIDYVRLRWFIRRLSQVGHPSGVKYCLEHFMELTPAIGEICQYFISVRNTSNIQWLDVGKSLLELLKDDLIKSNEYSQISIYSLFNRNIQLNHLHALLDSYKNASQLLQREIIIAAYQNRASDWIRELKESYNGMDPWTRRALLIASSILPKDERKHFLKSVTQYTKMEELIIKWVKSKE